MRACKRHFWTGITMLLAACGSDSAEPDSRPDAAGTLNTGGEMQAEAGASGTQGGLDGMTASPSDSGVKSRFLVPDKTLPEPAGMPPKAAILPGVSADVAACPEKSIACNGACLSTVGKVTAGCTALAITTKSMGGADGAQFLSMLVDGDVAFVTDYGAKTYRIALDGTGTTEIGTPIARRPITLWGKQGGKLIVTIDSDPGFDQTLATMDPTTGALTPFFTEVVNPGHVKVLKNTLFYTRETTSQDYEIYRREMPNGAPVKLFEVAGLRSYFPDDTRILISSVGESGGDPAGGLMLASSSGKGTVLGVSGSSLADTVFRTEQRAYWITTGRGLQYEFADIGSETVSNPIELPLSLGFVHTHDENFLYFTSSESEADRVYRMPINGGDLVPIATFRARELQDLAVHGKKLLAGVGYAATTGLVAIDLP